MLLRCQERRPQQDGERILKEPSDEYVQKFPGWEVEELSVMMRVNLRFSNEDQVPRSDSYFCVPRTELDWMSWSR